MNFSEKDIQQINAKGMSLEQVRRQLDIFARGILPVTVIEAATLGNGIVKLSPAEEKKYVSLFEAARDLLSVLKFVPASGAASRMFTLLFTLLHEFDPGRETMGEYIGRKKAAPIQAFFADWEKFPFYEKVLEKVQKKYPGYHRKSADRRKYLFVREMLDEKGCNYGACPKALLPFHRYKSHIATAFEEHLFEAALYGVSGKTARLHFTITESALPGFREEWNRIRESVQRKTGMDFDVTFSYQKPHTDTLAVHLDNTPFRKSDGALLFRPSGHGALLENLDEQQADILFIKNIDNVGMHPHEAAAAFYKKMLAGKLLELQETAFRYAALLDTALPGAATVKAIRQFLTVAFHINFPGDFKAFTPEQQCSYLRKKLNRPIRICGMVKNEGRAGGGPFRVKDEKGNISLQIVEAAQMNVKDPVQKKILEKAMHFNPVDMVCGIKNYKGEKYNLTEFADHRQGFITRKSRSGQTLKVLERPGLWNGGMACWNTVFVEVPLHTFTPVKTVNDLLKPAHQRHGF